MSATVNVTATEVIGPYDACALSDDVSLTPFEPGRGFPLFIQPRNQELYRDPGYAVRWLGERRTALDSLLLSAGAIVLRGFPIHDSATFAAIMDGYRSFAFGYTGGVQTRRTIMGNILEASALPRDIVITMHQEMAYLPHYPKKIAFYCRMPSVNGGQTFITNMREATARIDPVFFAEVKKRGIRYVRNFRSPTRPGLGNDLIDTSHKTWHQAFATTDPKQAEAGCRAMGLEPRWEEDGGLSVIYAAPGIINHPATGEQLWFNQIATLAVTPITMGAMYDTYVKLYAGRQRPAENTYGDGTPVPDEYADGINALLRDLAVGFSWSHGDVLLLDNYLVAHGRNTFSGARDIQVALMA